MALNSLDYRIYLQIHGEMAVSYIHGRTGKTVMKHKGKMYFMYSSWPFCLSDDSASTPHVIQRLAVRCGRGFGLPCPAALARNVKGTFLHMCYTTDIFNKTHTDMRRCIFMVCK